MSQRAKPLKKSPSDEEDGLAYLTRLLELRLNIILTRLKLAVLTGYSSYAVKGGAFVVSVDVLAPLAAIGITPPTHRSLLLCALCLK